MAGPPTPGGLRGWFASPTSYLVTHGPRADPATALTWGLIVLSLAVCLIVAVLVVAGAIVRRRRGATAALADQPVEGGEAGLVFFYVGMPLTLVALVGSLIWTVAVLAAVDSPAVAPRLTVEITGHQWWWEARYPGAAPGETFATANEVHIPIGQPVRLRLFGGDVIHSFWAPGLAGKIDTIPGQMNLAWIQADRPGVYPGPCTEYCGLQHAHMWVRVIAEPPAIFETWRQNELRSAQTPTTADALAGEEVFVQRCGSCHTVRGTAAGGAVGPDLTHLMSRTELAGGAVANTRGALSGWIENPQALKPGAQMPATWLSGPQLAQVTDYLETLK